MLQFLEDFKVYDDVNNLEISVLLTNKDIKKRMRENDTTFLEEVEGLILVAMDDNGNSYYVE
ncbi:hypothetical protein FH112_10705 [Staphylococcus hominis]|jgi:hypothetical protein|uniref:hypothetical protein n=1 Tax=Staphylococcus hominis TaxID=1290 RepID=UPI001F578C3A|nr:hypothetical protein [Staphylococcus hominis]MCI2891862.1 hypothetical protein [Staphylococcus hominis]